MHRPTSSSAAAPTVLVVDDEKDFRRIIQQVLESEGYCVLTASDGQTGLNVAREARPNLILLDLTMPGMDGREVLERLKADPDTADCTVAIYTGHDLDHAQQDALRASGAAAYMPKTMSLTELLATIQQLTR